MKLLKVRCIIFLCLFTVTATFCSDNKNELAKKETRLKVELFEGIIGQKWYDMHLAFFVDAAENVPNKIVDNEKLDSIAFRCRNNH